MTHSSCLKPPTVVFFLFLHVAELHATWEQPGELFWTYRSHGVGTPPETIGVTGGSDGELEAVKAFEGDGELAPHAQIGVLFVL